MDSRSEFVPGFPIEKATVNKEKSIVYHPEYKGIHLDITVADLGDDFVRRLQSAVGKIKKSREMEERYMVFEELLKEEREEGKAEGRAEGKAEDILELLADLGEIPKQLRKKILEERDLQVLKSYLKKAACAKSVEEFESLIK